jgi:cyanophycin synthetase
MITGTKGKTTVTHMLSHILTNAGSIVGRATTDGVTIGGKPVKEFDAAGYRGHALVFKDQSVTAAVLETARGGLLYLGMYVDRCDVAALLNVGREQIGIEGIDTVEQMAQHKRQVIDAARDTVVLNADDPHCARLIREYPVDRVTLFSLDPEARPLKDHLEAGGKTFCLDERGEPQIVRVQGSLVQTVASIADLPSTWGGILRYNIANAMAAAALADGLGISTHAIADGLQTFENTIEQSPGRFNIIEGYPFLLILDQAIHPPSAEALAACLTSIHVDGQRRCAITYIGNRPESLFCELTRAFAQSFDRFICYEEKKVRRGRAPGEIAELLKSQFISNGVNPDAIEVVSDYKDALKTLSANAEPGDLVVVLGGPERSSIPMVREAFASHLVCPQEIT